MQALNDLYAEIINMYGYEAEMSGALHQWNEMLKKMNQGSKTRKLFVGRSDPSSPGATFHYVKPFRDLISASAKNGVHQNTLRRSVVAMTYALWEDQYRQRIAYECGKPRKNEIESDVFYDLNKYRQAILHARGTLVGKTKVIGFFEPGEEVLLTDEHIYQLFVNLIDELNRIGRTYYNHDPEFSLDKGSIRKA